MAPTQRSMAAAATTAAANAVPTAAPIVHALGGSLGSALALLLMYPLERARIEMQAEAANRPTALVSSAAADPKPSPTASGGSIGRDEAVCQNLGEGSDGGERRAREATAPAIPSPNNSDSSSSSFEVVGHGAAHASSSDDDEECNLSLNTELVTLTPNESGIDNVWSTLTKLHQRGELYRGVKPVTTTLAISNFVFFYALQITKAMLASSGRKRARNIGSGDSGSATRIRSLLASSLAGVINVLLTNPLWVANLRIVQGYANGSPSSTQTGDGCGTGRRAAEPCLLSVMQQIAREEGLGQLWTGTWASLLLVANPAIQFFTYEQLRLDILGRRVGRNRKDSTAAALRTAGKAGATLSPAEAFIVGAVAKGLATIITYPVQLAQTLLRLQKRQTGGGEGGEPLSEASRTVDSGTLPCLVRLFREGGVGAIYAGMNAKMLQTVLTSAFTFLTYEQILAVVQRSLMMLPQGAGQ